MNRRRLMARKPTTDEGWISGVPYDLSSYTSHLNTYIDNNNGRVVSYNGWACTDFLPCHGVARFVASRGREYNALYDANKNYISRLNLRDGNTNNPHPEAYYVRFSYYTSEFSGGLSITPYST